MTDSFDPYHTWLGIPPEHQPPHHYRLLGVSVFEGNADVISNAADRQAMLLRTFQTGKHAALSQKLLNEVAAARVCLLRPAEKAAYDARLKKEIAAKSKRPGGKQPAASGPSAGAASTPAGAPAQQIQFPDLEVKSTGKLRSRQTARAPAKRARGKSALAIGGVAGLCVAATAVAWIVFSGGRPKTLELKLKEIEPVKVIQGDLVALDALVEDPEQWKERVRFQLGSDAPKGAKIDPRTGQFRWRPGKPGEYQVTVHVVADDSQAEHERGFLITVKEKARPLALAAIPDQSLDSSTEFRLMANVVDASSAPSKLQFSLGPDAPAGMKIDGSSGTITWRPADDCPAGNYRVTVRVQSTQSGGPQDEESFVIRLARMDNASPPVLAAIADQAVAAGKQLTVPVQLDDPGTDAGHLRFQLGSGAPSGMEIDPVRGTVTWQPDKDHAAGEYPVTVRVESTQHKQLGDEKTFRIRVAVADVGPPGMTGGAKHPAPGARHPAPDEALRAPVLTELKDRFKQEYGNRQPYARLALAAHLISQARDTKERPVERYVLLDEARNLATEQGDSLLPRLAVDELAASFDVDAVAMRIQDLGAAARRVRTPANARLILDAATALAKEAADAKTYDALLLSLRQVEKMTAKGSSSTLAQAVQDTRKMVQAMRELCRLSETAKTTLEKDPNDGQANLRMGRFYCLAHGDWEQGLSLLAKGSDDRLREPAVRLVAQSDDNAAQLGMADAWWELARKERREVGTKLMMHAAARHWYEQVLPRLADADLARAQGRLGAEAPPGKRPFLLSLGGVGGLSALAPKKVSGKVAPAGQFATFQGKGGLDYEPVPASSYIHELVVTFAQPQGTLSFTYGDSHEGARVSFDWNRDNQKYRCRLYTYRGGIVYWAHERNYDPQQTLHFTLYVNENRQQLYQNGARILSTGARPADLYFRIGSNKNTMVVISRCEFRRWTEVDAQRLKCSVPPTKIDSNWAEAGLRLHERNFELADRPLPADGKPFVTGTTGTAMQWIPAGTFERKPAADKKKPAAKKTPPTQVAITRGFWIGRYEISQGEWAAVVPVPESAIRVVGSPFLPVDGVSRDGAVKFCQLLTQLEKRARRMPPGYQYRLPTQAEWEYACRADSGEDFAVAADGIWSSETSQGRPHNIGQGKPNAWNLHDMHGNVSEWCLDAWRDEPKIPVARLTDPVVLAKNSSEYFVLRGGAWWKNRNSCASHAREKSKSIAGGSRGFRVVLGPVLR